LSEAISADNDVMKTIDASNDGSPRRRSI